MTTIIMGFYRDYRVCVWVEGVRGLGVQGLPVPPNCLQFCGLYPASYWALVTFWAILTH